MNPSTFAAKKAQINRAKKSHQFKTAMELLNGLAIEFAEPVEVEPTPKMIDERLVYCHLDSLAKMFDEPDLWGLPDDMTAEKFFNQGGNAIQKFLFQSWTDHKEFFDDEMWLSPFDAELVDI